VATTTDSTKVAMDAFTSAFTTGMQAGREMLSAVFAPAAAMVAQRVESARDMSARASGCSCEIPDPCWMPERLGPVVSRACPGATARLRIRVTNCGLGTRVVDVELQGNAGGAVSLDNTSVSLEPFESGEVTATVKVPDEGAAPVDVRIWIRGCRDHVLPWQVSVSGSGCSTTHEVSIDDCPDLVHHWYDHFYCVKPCYGGKIRLNG
jgi:hypothetical protein